ncbi:MAG: class I SAM-dependent methyltransferase [Acidobacteria bacterium]|nr:class I SAM-dependent methyltransferase [Acidobacteriota bacterium]
MTSRTQEDHARVTAAIADDSVEKLFTHRFLFATELFESLVDAACFANLDALGAFSGPSFDPRELGVVARAEHALGYHVRKLETRGYLARHGDRYHRTGAAPASPEACAQALAEVPEASVGGEIVSLLVAEGPAFFRGEKSGEEILFSPIRLPLWFRYFSNDNLLYSVNNELGALALSRELPPGGSILEVGGGCGSAAELALRSLEGRVARYVFTEVVPTFLRRGERAARAAARGAEVCALKLDMTRPWEPQGIVPGSFDAVYSVNCFHVAPDLDFVLREARAAVKPGGLVAVSECLRPTHVDTPIYVEFIFNFLESFTNVGLHGTRRPNHGFLTPAAWRASFEHAGLGNVQVTPDVDRVAETYPFFFVGALTARA